jgi:hypothetical protein
MAEHTPANDVVFNCNLDEPNRWITLNIQVSGGPLNRVLFAQSIRLLVRLQGDTAIGIPVAVNTQIRLELKITGEFIIESARRNWVGWSKIGSASFVLDRVNDAGFRPMDWRGQVLALKQLQNSAIIYGSAGITKMTPSGVTFGFRNILPIGIKSKGSVCGSLAIHYFIDRNDQLWSLTDDEVNLLDFAEYLAELSNPQLFYDEFLLRVIISDAQNGFIYTASGLGGGYGNLSAYTHLLGALVTQSPNNIIQSPLDFVTDVIDFGRRGQKTLESVHVGTDTTERLFLGYDYRFSKSSQFASTPWVVVNPSGVGFLKCAGEEFRIKIRSFHLTDFAVDYININYKTTDQRFSRSALVPISQGAFAGDLRSDNPTAAGTSRGSLARGARRR